MSELLDKMLTGLRERQEREEAERRSEFDWSGDIPDLEFLTPLCPVCGAYTNYDDGSYECPGCCVVWPRSGYGQDAEHGAEPR